MAAETASMRDGNQRREALDPERSFIVQAPAGSGKTELLIQRFLKLLSLAEHPEEVMAITFTRKAAGQMRQRVLDALDAADGPPPEEAHHKHTWELARAVQERERERGWTLAETPARLRIQTIDALCAAITAQLPWRSGMGGHPPLVEDASHLHLEAARAALGHLEKGGAAGEAVERLLTHLDNDLARSEGLLQSMLARRDQWLRHLKGPDKHDGKDSGQGQSGGALRAGLEAVLLRLAGEAMAEAHEAFPDAAPDGARDALPPLARHAAQHLEGADPPSPIQACRDMKRLPGTEPECLPLWLGLTELLLTAGGDWRRSLSKNQGFPAPSSAKDEEQREMLDTMKGDMQKLLASLQNEQRLRAALQALRELPPPAYSDAQWELLEALLTLLPLAVQELRRVFAAAGEVDFTEVALAAVAALDGSGSSGGAATALDSGLDYGIRHLLVDEFQDTSFSQFQLLERLTAGWAQAGGHTLFLVGDPMQSIYRFREADVGLYLRARSQGVGGLGLTPLSLEVNFRSTGGLVEWVNAAFPRVFPAEENPLTGAVAYSPIVAAHSPGDVPAVRVHPWLERNDEEEARRVVELVQTARAERPEGEVAILVRARSHLTAILPALRAAGLAYRGIDIDPLETRPAVQDLLALTRALHHPADRVAWLAVLRAPWCGLLLADLQALAGAQGQRTLWSAVSDPETTAGLSEDGSQRLARLREVMAAALQMRARGGLRRTVEGAWLALGGPAGLDDSEMADARACLDLLEHMEEDGEPPDPDTLKESAGALFAPPDPLAGPGLQIMTIHRAKGLEFDTVILPGLGRQPQPDQPRLLLWSEVPRKEGGGEDLLLAPVTETGEPRDEIYAYLAGLNKVRNDHEMGRLLYVAATRARKQLHLLGHAGLNARGEASPRSGSLLHKLWEVLAAEFDGAAAPQPGDAEEQDVAAVPGGEAEAPNLRRLPQGWSLPPAPETAAGEAMPDAASEEAEAPSAPDFLWAGDTARHVGTVVHRTLQRIAKSGTQGWTPEAVDGRQGNFRADLARLGVPQAELGQATEKVALAVRRTLADETGRWLLEPPGEADSELALTALDGGRTLHIQIDRTLVDQEGVRWIVDYKTGSHEGGSLESFLNSEQERYRAQLERYARVMRKHDPHHPIRLGLYFPLLQEFRTWTPPEDGEDQGASVS